MKNLSMKVGGVVLIIYFIYYVVLLFLLIGYVKDIIHLIHCDFNAPYKAEIIYGIGACSGLGGILGWINFGK